MTLDRLKKPDFSKFIPDFKLPVFKKSDLQEKPVLKVTRENDSGAAIVYKWQDKNGTWHFAGSCPDNIRCTIEKMPVLLRSEKKIPEIQQLTNENLRSEEPDKKTGFIDKIPDFNFPLTIPIQDAVKLKKDTEQLKIIMEEKYKTQENLMKSEDNR